MDGTLRSGDVARLAGVNIETLRYYERRSLLGKPPRTAGGFRKYAPEAVRRVRFIKRAQSLGFMLEEVRELIGLGKGTLATCEDVCTFAEQKINSIDEKIRQLQAMKRALRTLVDGCPGKGPKIECRIIESLGKD